MIYLYTNKDNKKEYVFMNNQFFNLYTANKDFTEEARNIILDIDRANLTEDNHIETKYGIGLLRNLSSGCKSYLNVIFNPDNFFRDIDIPVDLSPNVSSLVIADEDGIEMRMSPLGIYFDRSAKDLEHSGIGNIVLYYSDGHETQINDIGVHTCSGDGQYTGILYTDHQLIDIENCTKVKIGECVFNAIG